MPTITVRTPAGTLDAAQRAHLAHALTQAAAEAQRIPLDPRERARIWILFDEVESGRWFAGGVEHGAHTLPAAIDVALEGGVLDDAMRALYASRVQVALASALAMTGDPRIPVTAFALHELPAGRVAADGRLRAAPAPVRLATVPALAGV